MDGYVTTAEIAERWQCSKRWVNSLCKRGKLKATLMGNSYVVRERDADEYEHQGPGRPSANGKAHKRPAAKRSRKRRRNGRSSKA